LVELLGDPAMERTIIFTRTKRGADKVAAYLEDAAIPAAAIHGNKSQPQRERALAAFKAGKVRVLVATDIAARGIDIEAVSHVVNYELPEVPEAYVHRIGRTARAGAEGVAISLCGGDERDMLKGIEKLTRISLPTIDRRIRPGAWDPAQPSRPPDRRNEGRGQKQFSHKQGGNRPQAPKPFGEKTEPRVFEVRAPRPAAAHPGAAHPHSPKPHHTRSEQPQHGGRRPDLAGERSAGGNGGSDSLSHIGFLAQPQARPGSAPYRRPRPNKVPGGRVG
jgi:ATP-dependent RNA helicase RhlE